MYFGACYYPEHWPEERWEKDAKLMYEARFNVIRLAEFAWGKLEPSEGEFDFSWLDRAMNVMRQYGIKFVLGTPTAGPPKWLMDRYDAYQRDLNGQVRGFGTRKHYCMNHPDFHRCTERIVTQMAQHYGALTDVLGWQIDNEFGVCDTARCYCDHCLQAFKVWLQQKYDTIDAVNEAWGTVFSSQMYRSWDELHLPTYSVHPHHSPGLAIDYRRFASDSIVDYQRLQLQILRKYAPSHLITTNTMGKFNQLDHYDLNKELDLCALDVYPNMKSDPKARPSYMAEQLDITRGFKGGQNFWITEHQSGSPGAVVLYPTPVPGEIRRWTYQSIAHGADAIMYFRFRTLPYSIENLWHGILQHHGEPGRKFEEVKQIGQELEQLAPLLAGTSPQAKVAMIRCFDNEWSLELQPHMEGYEYIKHFETYYNYFYDRGITVDIVSPEASFGHYELLVAPNLMMAKDETVQSLYRYVEEGGCLIMDFRSGAKEMSNQITQKRLPGAFRDLLGIGIEDYGIIEASQQIGMRDLKSGEVSAAKKWYEVIDILDLDSAAQPIAVYTDGYYRDTPAATRRAHGKGCAVYIGTAPDQDGLYRLLDQLVEETRVKTDFAHLPDGVEAVIRKEAGAGGRELLFIINHSFSEVSVPLSSGYRDVWTNQAVSGPIELAAQDIRVLLLSS
ncbi:beta-galactosidase [Paenibacillus qinlingensis]|uniref:Beta-galactosidase n=1 Tax=Paenibacillus qinlingensis TaxID=1837343 RepID=A0ABU1P752_9BACL|nr:beta-galactosidase [Paenibacillus qinlingensis]MDR6554857.1 beta-galactosidase [Paenibacillus qinlingensis]